MVADIGLFILRLTLGSLMAGHGTQKLLGWWKGPGLTGTHGMMEHLGMRPGKVWGTLVAVGETSGGLLTMLGFLSPLGPLNIMSSMIVAIRRVHWKTPVWASEGGAELAGTNLAAATVLLLAGPGRYSLDSILGIRMPRWLTALFCLNIGAITTIALRRPDVAVTVVEKATSFVPSSLQPTSSPHVVMETRPAAADMQTTPARSEVEV